MQEIRSSITSPPQKRNALLGAILAALAVALGAFGAHALSTMVIPARLETFETAVRYQMYHGLALLILSLLPNSVQKAGIWLFLGTIIFSVSLYVLVLSDIGIFGAITPIGGVLQIIGWLVLIWGLIRLR